MLTDNSGHHHLGSWDQMHWEHLLVLSRRNNHTTRITQHDARKKVTQARIRNTLDQTHYWFSHPPTPDPSTTTQDSKGRELLNAINIGRNRGRWNSGSASLLSREHYIISSHLNPQTRLVLYSFVISKITNFILGTRFNSRSTHGSPVNLKLTNVNSKLIYVYLTAKSF